MITQMKTNITILSLLGLLIFATSGCSDWLETRPEGEIIIEEYWKTESDALQVLTGCYKAMAEGGYMDRIMVWGEGRSDNVTLGSVPTELNDILNQELEETNGYTDWTYFYKVINYCNTLLRFAPEAQKIDDNFTMESLRSMEAEAMAIRALSYFYLVRAFDNVPYITEPSVDGNQEFIYPQTKGSVILDSLVSDLNLAVRWAKDQHVSLPATKGRFTKSSINALLADIHLWRGDYNACINACDQVLSNPSLTLVKAETMLSRVFYYGNSSESIFELQYEDDKLENDMTKRFHGWGGNTLPFFTFPANLVLTQYSPFNFQVGAGYTESKEDFRAKDFIINNPTVSIYRIFKYAGASRREDASGESSTYSYRMNTSNWIFYRLSDVILMKAEALLQRDKAAGIEPVLKLVNQTYLRSNPDADSLRSTYYSGINEIENLILRERQRELMFEGKRYFDLMRLAIRNGNTSDVTNYLSKTSSSTELYGNMSTIESLYWPINKKELIANPLLKQNPFYENTYKTASN